MSLAILLSLLTPLPAAPAELDPGPTERAAFSAHAVGVQIYRCDYKDQHFAWTLTAPEADLTDAGGNKIIHHQAGPVWQSLTDQSSVTGQVSAHHDAPSSSDIAWLLVRAKSHSGIGRMTDVTSIQRLNTKGGLAPSQSCMATNKGQLIRVPYQADYVFFHLIKS